MNILVLGANSDVAFAVVKKFSQTEKPFFWLAARNMELLEKKVKDLEIRYSVQARAVYFDALDYKSHEAFYQSLIPKPDIVILTFGYLGNQELAQNDFNEALKIIQSNFCGAVSILEIVAADFSERRSGSIIAISSVAGERGRQGNYFYGAAKGALTIYLSGLRNRLSKNRIKVITVLPGFIRTKMTAGLDLPAFLTSSPESAADAIYNAYKKSKSVIYVKWYWRWIMLVIKLIPEPLFMQMKL